MQSIVMLSDSYAECHIQAIYAEWHYAECCDAEYLGAQNTLTSLMWY